MSKYIMLWKTNQSLIPQDSNAQAEYYLNMMKGITNDLEDGKLMDWGVFPSEGKGYSIVEGNEKDLVKLSLKYVPFVQFECHPVLSASEIVEVLTALKN